MCSLVLAHARVAHGQRLSRPSNHRSEHPYARRTANRVPPFHPCSRSWQPMVSARAAACARTQTHIHARYRHRRIRIRSVSTGFLQRPRKNTENRAFSPSVFMRSLHTFFAFFYLFIFCLVDFFFRCFSAIASSNGGFFIISIVSSLERWPYRRQMKWRSSLAVVRRR